MASPSLQRSGETFRRSGSSGLVWEDRIIAEEGIKTPAAEPAGAGRQLQRSSSAGAGYVVAAKLPADAADPPSPKVGGCGICAVFATPKPKPCRRRR